MEFKGREGMMAERSKPTTDWWLEIRTGIPCCLYYFGPFLTAEEAERHAGGYIDDLIMEGAQEIWLIAKQCHPTQLTFEFNPKNESDRVVPRSAPHSEPMGREKQRFAVNYNFGGGGYCAMPQP